MDPIPGSGHLQSQNMRLGKNKYHRWPGGGGGGGYSPQSLVGIIYVPRQSETGQGLRNELPIERENVGLRNELGPFWAWKCGDPD